MNKIISIIFLIAILIGIDCIWVHDIFRSGKLRYCLLSGLLAAAWSLKDANRYIALFAAWSGICWVFYDFPTYGTIDVLMIYSCFFLAWYLKKELGTDVIAKIISYCALGEAVYGIMQICGIEPFFTLVNGPGDVDFHHRAIGTMGHPSLYAPFIACGLLYFFSRRNYCLALICATAIVLTKSTTANIAILVAAFYMYFRVKPKSALFLGSISVWSLLAWKMLCPIGGALDLDGRQFIWPYALAAWRARFLIGWGPGGWLGNYATWQIPGAIWGQVHSDWLQCGIEQGAVGLGIALCGSVKSLINSFRHPSWLGAWLILFCVEAIGNFTMHVACFGLIACFVLITLEDRHGLAS